MSALQLLSPWGQIQSALLGFAVSPFCLATFTSPFSLLPLLSPAELCSGPVTLWSLAVLFSAQICMWRSGLHRFVSSASVLCWHFIVVLFHCSSCLTCYVLSSAVLTQLFKSSLVDLFLYIFLSLARSVCF